MPTPNNPKRRAHAALYAAVVATFKVSPASRVHSLLIRLAEGPALTATEARAFALDLGGSASPPATMWPALALALLRWAETRKVEATADYTALALELELLPDRIGFKPEVRVGWREGLPLAVYVVRFLGANSVVLRLLDLGATSAFDIRRDAVLAVQPEGAWEGDEIVVHPNDNLPPRYTRLPA